MAARRSAPNPSPQAPDERTLVEAAQRDPLKFDALYELHFERVYAFVVRRVHDRVTAEDLTSDVFHKALANLSKYEWRGAPFAAWLFRIAANAIADQSKRAVRNAPPVGHPPEAQRRVIHQRFVDERSIREIAQQLGKTEGAIKQLQFRALQSLRAQMEGGHA